VRKDTRVSENRVGYNIRVKSENLKIKNFQNIIRAFYKKNGRALPWRNTDDPYKILISEIMLQQTQVSRVLQKYEEFLKAFPTVKDLAKAPIKDVFSLWQGMGYNRRALYLKKTAEEILSRYNGKTPSDPSILLTFPGIGKTTAASVVTFSYNVPTVFIETNIRRVFIHFFFADKLNVHDKDIFPLIEKTLDRKNPREWYYALMDYGNFLAKKENANHRSAHYKKASPFKDSNREIRGTLLRTLVDKTYTFAQLQKEIPFAEERIIENINTLVREGFIKEQNGKYAIQ